jgi:hypothetical protein
MSEQTPELSGIVCRLERVERQNQRLKRAGLAFLALASAIVLMGQSQAAKNVEAQSFVLRDSRGNIRAMLALGSGDAPTFMLRDANGQPQILLEGGDHPVISLSRTGGKEQVTLMASEEVYGLAVYGEPKGAINGTRVGLGVWKGVPGLTLYDADGNERATIQTEQSGPSVRLTDAAGKARAELIMASDTPGLHLGRDGVREGLLAAVDPNQGPYITLSDKDVSVGMGLGE